MTLLCGDRLRYERLTPAHATAMHPLLADERLYRFMADTRFDTVGELTARYQRLAKGSPDPAEVWVNFVVFVGEAPHPIGFVQATVYPPQRIAEIAYVLGTAHWGQGYATEAARWLLRHLREAYDLDGVQAQIDGRNTASIGVVRRLGLVYDRPVDDGSEDVIYAAPLAGLVDQRL